MQSSNQHTQCWPQKLLAGRGGRKGRCRRLLQEMQETLSFQPLRSSILMKRGNFAIQSSIKTDARHVMRQFLFAGLSTFDQRQQHLFHFHSIYTVNVKELLASHEW